jgi:hypothetical protein
MAFNYLYKDLKAPSVFKKPEDFKEMVIDDEMATNMRRLINSTKIDEETKKFYIRVLNHKVEGRDLTMSYNPKIPGGGVDFLNKKTGGWIGMPSHGAGVLAMMDADKGIEKPGQEGNPLAPENPGYDQVKLSDDAIDLLEAQLRGGAIKGDQADYIKWLISGKKKGVDKDVTIGKDFLNRKISYKGTYGQVDYPKGLAPKGTSDLIYNAINTVDTEKAKREEAINKPTGPITPVSVMEHLTKKGYGETPAAWEQLVKPPPVKPSSSIKQYTPDMDDVEVADKLPPKNKSKRAASVGKNKLSSYDKVWKDNKGGIQQKYKTKADFVKAADAWWAKKGL